MKMSEYKGDGPPLVEDRQHANACHERWLTKAQYGERMERGEARAEQCLFCRYYIPLMGALAEDWGACSNPSSLFDGQVMFEHDGCEEFSPADEW
jgi:hypothetical protein